MRRGRDRERRGESMRRGRDRERRECEEKEQNEEQRKLRHTVKMTLFL